MKIIELNIGLSSKTLGKLSHIEILNALTGRGFECLKYRLVESTCKDGPEVCLAWKGTPPSDWQEQLASLSDKLGQDCIGIAGFIGQSPYDAFIPSLWVTPHRYKIQYRKAGGEWTDSRRPLSGSLPTYATEAEAQKWIDDSTREASYTNSRGVEKFEYQIVPDSEETEETEETEAPEETFTVKHDAERLRQASIHKDTKPSDIRP